MPSDMNEIELFITADGSIGLYNNKVKDIYHSKFGAYTESMDKFIIPAEFEKQLANNTEIKILDICYGMGYNTKSAIKKIAKINPEIKINIDAIENDEKVILLSAITNENIYSKELNQRILNQIYVQREKFSKNIDIDFFNKIFKNGTVNLPDNAFKYFMQHKYTSCIQLITFLHNIYYHYVSNSAIESVNPFKINDFYLNYKINDARKIVQQLNCNYDFIFLDAFTPKLQPSLWSFDFFKALYLILKPNGRLLTYSSAAPVRSAMIKAGFYIYKNIDNSGKSIGTIATKSVFANLNKLNEKEFGVLKTKSGIFYRDEGLNNSVEDIIKIYENERTNSDRQSASSYLKEIGEKINV